MNNLLSFNEYFNGKDIDEMFLDDELNEKHSLRRFLNKTAQGKVRAELAEEIEMSKNIMDGIKDGLESLNSGFEKIKNELEKSEDNVKSDKRKVLDDISKIIEDSKKASWNLNDLIDDGEIDYAGFTANLGVANLTYFGVLLFPVRASLIMHKGYNYFFTTVKNTIRKALVMLQLNFDQFENLIITKSFQSAGWVETLNTNSEIADYYSDLEAEYIKLSGKKNAKNVEAKLKLARDKANALRQNNKAKEASESAYNCLDLYNNTYTKSLETLRQYTQEDVQKQLDSIKVSIGKLAGGDVDLQAYGELIIAAAEEHAFKVSSSIYNKFAKMTEVFSLPNQQKLIDLIQETTSEEKTAAAKEKAEKLKNDKIQNKKAELEKLEKNGSEIFTKLEKSKLGELKDGKYEKNEINGDVWTYDEFKKLSDDDQDTLERWFMLHPEVIEKCDDTLKVAIPVNMPEGGYFDYVDSLIDLIGSCLISKLPESVIMDFDDYVFESSVKTSLAKPTGCYIDTKNLDNKMIDTLKSMYIKKQENGNVKDMDVVAKIALEMIGKKILKDKGFTNNVESIYNIIAKALKAKKKTRISVKPAVYKILKESIHDLKEMRSQDYATMGEEIEIKEKKSEE